MFNRKAELIINNRLFSLDDFDIDFTVDFDSDVEPKVQSITVYNLSRDSANSIQKGDNVILNAGYEDNKGSIVVGNIAYYETRKGITDTEFIIYVVSNLDRWSRLTISKTYRAGTRVSVIIQDILSQFGIEIGEFSLVNDFSYKNSRTVSGILKNVLEELVKEAGSRLYISDNVLFITKPFTGTVTGFLLSPETGLISSPEKIEVEEQEGYKVEMLLNHRISVNSVIKIESDVVSGNFIVIKGTHTGDFITTAEVLQI